MKARIITGVGAIVAGIGLTVFAAMPASATGGGYPPKPCYTATVTATERVEVPSPTTTVVSLIAGVAVFVAVMVTDSAETY